MDDYTDDLLDRWYDRIYDLEKAIVFYCESSPDERKQIDEDIVLLKKQYSISTDSECKEGWREIFANHKLCQYCAILDANNNLLSKNI